MHIGLKIKELADKKNLTLADIGKVLGKTKQAIYEMVDKEDVNTSILKKLSQALNTPISFFFNEDDNSDANIQEKLTSLKKELDSLRQENAFLKAGKTCSTKVVVEFDVTPDEFIKMGLKDKIVQVVNNK